MTECKNCGTEDAMYQTRNGKKCYNCGYTPDYNHNISNEHPTREADSKCGDVISATFDGVSRAATRKATCKDETMCSITPSGIKEDGNKHVVVCTFHQD
jgi:hypothetical protein